MKFTLVDIRARVKADALVLSCFEGEQLTHHPLWSKLGRANQKLVAATVRAKTFLGKAGECKVVFVGRGSKLFLLGLGKRNTWSQRKFILAVRRVVAAARAEGVRSFYLAPEPMAAEGLGAERLVQLVVENATMVGYQFGRYKSKPEPVPQLAQITLAVGQSALGAARAGLKVGEVIGEAVNTARELGNTPGGEMTPSLLARRAQELGREHKFKVQVLGRRELIKLKAGAILGVAHGSAEEPKLIVVEYRGGSATAAPYVFVGKGVTFDTGGLNLKPEKSMLDMHLDMSGGAAVLAALSAVARLKLKLNLVGIIPAVENMPGSAGYRPGDVLTSLSGKTIEILNTDAEGRVILADALTYAERFKPQLVVDVATLTGACMVALGLKISGLLTPDAALQQELTTVGEAAGDYVWPLPLMEEHEDEVRGTFGDVQNMGKTPYGGAISGAAFLWQFAKAYPWAHLDIAGPMKTVEGQYLAPGASGVGVRFLIELARRAAVRG